MTKKFNKRDQKLLTRYLEGKCSKEELEALDQWYRSLDQGGRDKFEMPDIDDLCELKSEMFENITKGIGEQEAQSKNMHKRKSRGRKVNIIKLKTFKRLAAIITVGISLGIFIYSQLHDFRKRTQISDVKLTNDIPVEERAKVNGPATIYLSDGSVVWVNKKSRLEYPKAFTGGIREVRLTGEAFFDVAKNSGRPFVIHSTNFTTRVLGTSFKIKDHEGEESQEVEVVTGKVIVSVKGTTTDNVKELILKSNRKAVYSKKDNTLVEIAASDGSVQKLTPKSKLEFNEVALKDILKVLSAAHGVNITMANERMKNCIITADLSNETLEISLAIISKAINADFTVRGNDIILSGDGCMPSQ